MEEKRFVLTGGYTGLLYLEGREGGVTVRLRCAGLPPCRLYWAYPDSAGCAVRDAGVTLREGESTAFCALGGTPVGVVLAQAGRVLCAGGFTGREKLREQAAMLARLKSGKEPPEAAPAARGATPPIRTEESAEAPAETLAEAPVEARPTGFREPPTHSPSPVQPIPRAAPPPTAVPVGPPPEAEPAAAPPALGGESDALKQILTMAQNLFGPLRESAQAPAPSEAEQGPGFGDAFPGAVWKKVRYPGSERFYWEGAWQNEKGRYVLHALPGEYAPVPPYRGFRRFLRGADGSGYWLRTTRRG